MANALFWGLLLAIYYTAYTFFFIPRNALIPEVIPDAAVVPFLLTAGTDARRFTDIADHILHFAPIDLNKAQFATIHGADEHIGIENIGQCVVFYRDFIKMR